MNEQASTVLNCIKQHKELSYHGIGLVCGCTRWQAINAVNRLVERGAIEATAKEWLGDGDYLMEFEVKG